MIFDAHHHFWNYNPAEFGWIDNSMEILKKNYLPQDLEQQLFSTGVTGTVVVQARQTLEETKWLLGLAEEYHFIKAVVGWVDLQSEKISDQFNIFSDFPYLVGVRHVIHDEPDDNFILRKEFLRGIAKLQKQNLTYDLLLYPKHLRRAIELVSRFPEQKFILDHIGKPLIKSEIIHPWKEDIEEFAKRQNVWCKISGMVTEADLFNWKYEDLIPYMDTVLEAFGPNRILLGSDWPACRLAGEYSEIMNAGIRYVDNLSENEQKKIFCDNCLEFYNINNF